MPEGDWEYAIINLIGLFAAMIIAAVTVIVWIFL